MNNFERDKLRGKKTEDILLDLLKKSENITYLKDVRMDLVAQKNDYDFIYQLKNEEYQLKVEVKSDERINKTRNIFAEVFHQSLLTGEFGQGWITYTKADYIFYYDTVSEFFYVIYTPHLKEYIKDKKPILKSFDEYDKEKQRYIKRNNGYLVNIDDFMKKYEVSKLKKDGSWIMPTVAVAQ